MPGFEFQRDDKYDEPAEVRLADLVSLTPYRQFVIYTGIITWPPNHKIRGIQIKHREHPQAMLGDKVVETIVNTLTAGGIQFELVATMGVDGGLEVRLADDLSPFELPEPEDDAIFEISPEQMAILNRLRTASGDGDLLPDNGD